MKTKLRTRYKNFKEKTSRSKIIRLLKDGVAKLEYHYYNVWSLPLKEKIEVNIEMLRNYLWLQEKSEKNVFKNRLRKIKKFISNLVKIESGDD